MENLNYTIFNVSELQLINFAEILESSAATLRKSVDGTKTFVKWEGSEPACIADLTTAQGPYSHAEILGILSGSAWTFQQVQG
jgi:hypothetical protein